MNKDLHFMAAVMMILDKGAMYIDGEEKTKFYFSAGLFRCWYKGKLDYVELMEWQFRAKNWVVNEDWVEGKS